GHGARPGQVALAWLLQRGEHVVPIPGTKRRTYLEENIGAASLTLTQQDIAVLDGARQNVSGARYTERGLAMLDKTS
ncbi:MAG TPA: aldo/keto reductase, partial [Rhizomicrobium sp.]|nr:aldo/keto reductase [Rhizomicrobium sp.]